MYSRTSVKRPALGHWKLDITFTKVCPEIDKLCVINHQHHHERHGKYRLEDEELTHLGQSLSGIDKFEDVQLSDDDDNVDKEDAGKNYCYDNFCHLL